MLEQRACRVPVQTQEKGVQPPAHTLARPAHGPPAAEVAGGAQGTGRRQGRGRRGLVPLTAYTAPMLAVYGLFVLWPLLYLAGLSLMQWDGYSAPSFVGLGNYGALWSDPGFGVELQHSVIWLAVTLVVPPVVGLALALLLSAASPRIRAMARALLLVPLLFPSVVIATAWRLLYNPLSGPLTGLLHALGLGALAGDWLGDPRLALPALLVPACWAAFGLSMLVFGAALSAIDPAVLAAAQVDGAGPWARLCLIILPGLRGAIPLAVVATALCAVPAFDLVLLMTNGGPGYATTILPLDMYGRAFGGGQVGAGAAIACLQSLIGVALTGAALILVIRRGQAGDERSEDGAGGGRARRGSAGRAAAGLALLGLTAVVVFPVAWLVALSLRPAPTAPPATPWANLWQNVAAVWANGFGAAFLTSLGISVVVAVCTLALAAPAAFALAARRRARGRGVVLVLLAIGLFQPGAVLIVPLFNLLRSLNMLDSLAGLIVPEVARALPVAVLLLWIALRGLPSDVLAAAEVDGAAPRQVLRRVALPLSIPMLVVAGLWSFLSSWNEFLLPTVVLQDETVQTVPLALSHFVGRVDTQYALLAAGALLSIAPLLALYGGFYGAIAAGVRGLRRAGGWR